MERLRNDQGCMLKKEKSSRDEEEVLSSRWERKVKVGGSCESVLWVNRMGDVPTKDPSDNTARILARGGR